MHVPIARLFEFPPLTGIPWDNLTWRPGGEAFTFLEATGPPDEDGDRADLWSAPYPTGERTRLAVGDAVMADTAQGRRRVPLSGCRWFPTGGSLLLLGHGRAWRYQPGAPGAELLIADCDEQVSPVFSPTGDRLAFVRDHNLWVCDLDSGHERAITGDGGPCVLNGKLDWVYWEELAHRGTWQSFQWSPDGRYLAFLRLDQTCVPDYPLVDAGPRHATVTPQRYPNAGDPNAVPALLIAEANSGRLIAAKRLPDDAAYIGPALEWLPNSTGVAWSWLRRDQRRLELRLLDLDGRCTTLLVEEDPYWLNHIGPPHFLPDGGFLWLTERDGPAQVYRHAEGAEDLLAGGARIERLHCVHAGEAIVTASEDARERRLGALDVASSALRWLSPARQTATLTWHRELGRGFATIGDVETPPEPYAVTPAGVTRLRTPERAWRGYAWARPMFHEVTAADGCRLHGVLLRPDDFDPARRYPVVVHVYGGPHAQTVRDCWPGADALDQLLVQAGLLVWKLDNRGSWGRGHAFEAPVNRRLGAQELMDQLEGVRFLRELPYVDADRIGITGWSYGGYLALFALTRAPAVWRCGAAGAPVTDWALYDSIYTERYMGVPQEEPAAYAGSAILGHVGALQAPLMLAHGTADDNVHLQHTLRLLEELSQHRKPYELLLQPGQAHGFVGSQARLYLHERLVEFLTRHLMA